MRKLIYADDLIKALNLAEWFNIADFNEAIYTVKKALPVDVVPVIRCESCIFWDKAHVSCEGLAKCCTGEGGIRYRNRSDFCSRGAREDGDNAEGSV